MPAEPLVKLYDQLRNSAIADLKSATVADKLAALCERSLDFLRSDAELWT